MSVPSAFALGLLLVLRSVAQDSTASLTGKVEDITGAGVPRTHVELRSETSPDRAFHTQADDTGSYRLSGLPADKYTLNLSSPGFQELTVKSIHISDGEQKLMPVLELLVGSLADCGGHAALDYFRFLPLRSHVGNLRGTVRLDQGPMVRNSPTIAGADVMLICGRDAVCGKTKTDSNGEFVFRDFSAGSFVVRVARAGFYPLDTPGYYIRQRRESVYHPIYIERCPLGDCDPRHRPRKPPARCE